MTKAEGRKEARNAQDAQHNIDRVLSCGADGVAVEIFRPWRGGGAACWKLNGLMWISIAVVCLGYLLWRFMSRLFWHKYFHEDPPDEDE